MDADNNEGEGEGEGVYRSMVSIQEEVSEWDIEEVRLWLLYKSELSKHGHGGSGLGIFQ